MRVICVCLGNICRSPTAEAVIRVLSNGQVVVDSVGTSDWHIGDRPYGPAIEAAAKRGYDLTPLRARQLTSDDFTSFDLMLAMDKDNLRAIEAVRPAGNNTPVKLFLDFAPHVEQSNVPDPYYTRDFEGALDLIEVAARGLLAKI
ncbi:MAG: low molecular weight protein-tyrosine-phosphatase [Pseudomonadota bacterium]